MTKIPDKRVIEDRLDLEMLERPHLWPHGNAIFLRRDRDGQIETAVCVLDEGRYVVRRHRKEGTQQVLVGTIGYRDAQMVFDDGWRVD